MEYLSDLINFETNKKYNVKIIDTPKEEQKEEQKEEFKNTNTVICGNEQPLTNNNDWMIKNIEYSEPSETEKKLLEGTITAEELIKKEQEEKEEVKDEETINNEKRKEYITKVKVLALYKCKYYPLSNPSNFTYEEKQRIINKMSKIIKHYTEDELTSDFNEVINNMLLDPKTNYGKLPIMKQ